MPSNKSQAEINVLLDVAPILRKLNTGNLNKSLKRELDKYAKATKTKPISLALPEVDLGITENIKGFEKQQRQIRDFANKVDKTMEGLDKSTATGKNLGASLKGVSASYRGIAESLEAVDVATPSPRKLQQYNEALKNTDSFFNDKRFNSTQAKRRVASELRDVAAYYKGLKTRLDSANTGLKTSFGESADGRTFLSDITKQSDTLGRDINKVMGIAKNFDDFEETRAKRSRARLRQSEVQFRRAIRAQEKLNRLTSGEDGTTRPLSDLSPNDKAAATQAISDRDRSSRVATTGLEQFADGNVEQVRQVKDLSQQLKGISRLGKEDLKSSNKILSNREAITKATKAEQFAAKQLGEAKRRFADVDKAQLADVQELQKLNGQYVKSLRNTRKVKSEAADYDRASVDSLNKRIRSATDFGSRLDNVNTKIKRNIADTARADANALKARMDIQKADRDIEGAKADFNRKSRTLTGDNTTAADARQLGQRNKDVLTSLQNRRKLLTALNDPQREQRRLLNDEIQSRQELGRQLKQQATHLDNNNRLAREGLETERARKAQVARGQTAYTRAGAASSVRREDLDDVREFLKDQRQGLDNRKTAKLRSSAGLTGAGLGAVNAEIGSLNRALLKNGVALDTVGHKMNSFNDAAHQAGSTLRLFLRYAVGYGVMYQMLAAVTGLVSGLAELDQRLQSIKAISASTDTQMRSIRSAIKSVAVTTEFNITEIASAAQTLAQAGVAPREMESALRNVALFASATNSTLEISADLISTMKNVFTDLSDGQIADQLTKAVNISKLTGDDLQTILSRGLQVAKAYNIASDQFLSAVTVLRNAGIKASTVSTGLRQSVLELLSPDAKTLKVLEKRYAELGESLSIDEIKAKFFGFTSSDNPLLTVLKEMKRLGADGSAKSAFDRVFDVRAANVINVLLRNLDQLDSQLARLGQGGAAAQGAKTQLDSLTNSMKNLGAEIISLSDTMAGDFVQSVAKATRSLTGFLEAYEDSVIATTARGGDGTSDVGTAALVAGTTFAKTRGGLVSKSISGLAAGGATYGGLKTARNNDLSGLADGAGIVASLIPIALYIKKVRTTMAVAVTAISSSGVITHLSRLSLFLRASNPIGWIVSLALLAYQVFSYVKGTSGEEQLNAASDRLAKLQNQFDKETASLEALDSNKSGSPAAKAQKLVDTVTSFKQKLADILGKDISDLDNIDALAEGVIKLGTEGLDSGSLVASNLRGSIAQGAGLDGLTAEQASLLTDLGSEAASAAAQIAVLKEELIKQYAELAGRDDLTNAQQTKQAAIKNALEDGFGDSVTVEVDGAAITKIFADALREAMHLVSGRELDEAKEATNKILIENSLQGGTTSITKFGADALVAADGSKKASDSGASRAAEIQSQIQSLQTKLDTPVKVDLRAVLAGMFSVASIFNEKDSVGALQARIDGLEGLLKAQLIANNINTVKAQKTLDANLKSYADSVDKVNKIIEGGGPGAEELLANLRNTKGGVESLTRKPTTDGYTGLDKDTLAIQKDLDRVSGKSEDDKRVAIEVTLAKQYRTTRGELLLEQRLKAAEAAARSANSLDGIAEIDAKLHASALNKLAVEQKIIQDKLDTQQVDGSDEASATRLSLNNKKDDIIVARAAENDNYAAEKLALEKEISLKQNDMDQAILSASNNTLNQELEKLDGSSTQAEVVREEILDNTIKLAELELQKVIVAQGDVEAAKAILINKVAEAKAQERITELAEQRRASDDGVKDADRLSDRQVAKLASGNALTRQERGDNLRRGIEARRSSIATSENQLPELKATNYEAYKLVAENVKDLKEQVTQLNTALYITTRSLNQSVIDGYNWENIRAQIEATAVSAENLADKIRDNLTNAFIETGDAIADALVDGENLLASLKNILYETAKTNVKDQVKANLNTFILDKLPGGEKRKEAREAAANPQATFSSAVDRFGNFVDRLPGASPATTPLEEGLGSVVGEALGLSSEEGLGSVVGDSLGLPSSDTTASGGTVVTGSGLAGAASAINTTAGASGEGEAPGGVFSQAFDKISQGFGNLFSGEGSLMTRIGGAFQGLFGASGDLMSGIGGVITGLFTGGGSGSSGGGGGGGGIGGILQAGISLFGFAKGGVIGGSGSATADDKVIAVSTGEAVLNAKAVKAIGPAGVNNINRGALKSGKTPNNVGKVAPNTPNITMPDVNNSTRIVNVIDPDMAQDFMESSAGERVIVNAIKRNSGAIKQLVG